MVGKPARGSTSVLVTLSCQEMPSRHRRLLRWKVLSFFSWRAYVVRLYLWAMSSDVCLWAMSSEFTYAAPLFGCQTYLPVFRDQDHRLNIVGMFPFYKYGPQNFTLAQESITRSVYLTHDYVLGLWVNRFAWINWIPRDSMYLMAL